MAFYKISNHTHLVTAQTTDKTICALVPAATVNFKIVRVVLGCNNAGGAITDFDITVGLNRPTTRGTAAGTITGAAIGKSDPNTASSGITGFDYGAYSVEPTFATIDDEQWSFNSRGGFAATFNFWDIVSNVGTANPIAFVHRSGGTLPANHAITVTVEWLE